MNKARFLLILALIFFGLTGCQSQDPSTPISPVTADNKYISFNQFSSHFVSDFWHESPTWALYSGYHKYDGVLKVPNEHNRALSIAFNKKKLAKLGGFDLATLSPNERIDYRLIEVLLMRNLWDITTFKSWQWDPSSYNVAGGFAQIMNEDFAPLDSRLRSVLSRLENVPAYYEAARQNIVNPTLEHTQLALMQNQGALSVFSENLLDSVKNSGLTTADKLLFEKRFNLSVLAVTQQIEWLSALAIKLEQEGTRSFRIGAERYEQKFSFEIQSAMSAKALYEKALKDKARVQGEMAKITSQLWSTYFDVSQPKEQNKAIRQLIDKLSAKHIKREHFVDEVRAQIPELVKFVNEKKLVTLNPEKPLVVRETPAYMRGFAGASISALGPYEKSSNTYYNVTPLDTMDDESAESYLREYNHWILQVLNIHEAIPGHYTQLVYSNESPSMIKSLGLWLRGGLCILNV